MYIKEKTLELVCSPEAGANLARALIEARPPEEQHKEYFYVIGLDCKNRVLIIDLISIGTIGQCNVYLREIIKTLILKDCSGCILVHNHPSGDSFPSAADNAVTKNIVKAVEIMEMKVLDHLIIGAGKDYYSYKSNNKL